MHAATLIAKDIGRRSSLLMKLASMARRRRAIRTIEELDGFVDDFARRHPSGDIDQAGVEELLGCYYAPEIAMPADPFSREYREAQWGLFLSLNANGRYDVADEGSVIDFAKNRDSFYPYNLGAAEVSKSLISRGAAINAMGLRDGQRVVEFGPGWGNLAVDLAMMGIDVSVVEANQAFIDLIEYRAGRHGKKVRAVQGDMADFARSTDERFDAAIFVASFHHCAGHMEMLGSLARIVKPGGQIAFIDEPVMYAANPLLPYPWGVRLDGLSLYFVRRHGWLELGFQHSYLREAVRRAGFSLRRFPSFASGVPDLFVAKH